MSRILLSKLKHVCKFSLHLVFLLYMHKYVQNIFLDTLLLDTDWYLFSNRLHICTCQAHAHRNWEPNQHPIKYTVIYRCVGIKQKSAISGYNCIPFQPRPLRGLKICPHLRRPTQTHNQEPTFSQKEKKRKGASSDLSLMLHEHRWPGIHIPWFLLFQCKQMPTCSLTTLDTHSILISSVRSPFIRGQ